MSSTYRLPLRFDSQALKSDLQLVSPEEWISHFNTHYFDGEWSGIALRSTKGAANDIYPDPNTKGSALDTPVLERCSNLRAVLANFRCPVGSARLLKLGPGAHIREHRDYDLGVLVGEVRLHIPIATNPQVEFFLDNERIEMQEGECWYLDFSLPHRVHNGGATDRIHLVIDCVLDDWLRTQLPEDVLNPIDEGNGDAPSNPADLERFRQHVLLHPDLQEKLRQSTDRFSFARLVVRLASQNGYHFSATDVQNEMRAERQALIERRWID